MLKRVKMLGHHSSTKSTQFSTSTSYQSNILWEYNDHIPKIVLSQNMLSTLSIYWHCIDIDIDIDLNIDIHLFFYYNPNGIIKSIILYLVPVFGTMWDVR